MNQQEYDALFLIEQLYMVSNNDEELNFHITSYGDIKFMWDHK